jgi:hypothetical protein
MIFYFISFIFLFYTGPSNTRRRIDLSMEIGRRRYFRRRCVVRFTGGTYRFRFSHYAKCQLDELQGNYLSNSSTTSASLLTYFPSTTLPIDPAARFADLFLMRTRWKGEDIAPFLSDIAVDSKERDKLLLKYARATAGSEGVLYAARAQYNG